jgi:hypothetical protein
MWAHPKVDLGDVGQVEARFGLFANNVNLDARYVYGLQIIEEPARTRRTSTQLPNKYEGFNLKTQDGEVLKTIS